MQSPGVHFLIVREPISPPAAPTGQSLPPTPGPERQCSACGIFFFPESIAFSSVWAKLWKAVSPFSFLAVIGRCHTVHDLVHRIKVQRALKMRFNTGNVHNHSRCSLGPLLMCFCIREPPFCPCQCFLCILCCKPQQIRAPWKSTQMWQ